MTSSRTFQTQEPIPAMASIRASRHAAVGGPRSTPSGSWPAVWSLIS